MRDFLIVLGIIIVVVLCVCDNPIKERFQRMNYIQMHNYLDNKYGSGLMRHGFEGNYNPFYSDFRNRRFRHGYVDTNVPKLVGYIYSQDEANNDMFPLYEMYDYKRGRPGYVYRDSKYGNDRDAVLVVIDPDNYEGDTLYDDDIVTVGLDKKPYIVKLYKIKNVGLGTRYTERDYRDEMQGYGLLKPVNTEDTVIEDEDRYYILYRQTLDPRRGVYNYYIKDKRGAIIELDDDKYKELDDGDMVLIPGKERYGEYQLEVYNDDYGWWY